MLAHGFEQVESADSVGIEIVEGHRCGKIVARLSGCMHDGVRLELLQKIEHSLAVADIEFVVNEPLDGPLEAMLVPTVVALGAKEDCTLIVIDSMNLPTLGGKIKADFGADKTG